MARRVITALAAGLVLAGLAGCGTAPEAAAPAAADGFPITISDAMGQVTIPTKPVRVAALDASYVDAAIALEAQVVAFTAYRGISDKLPDYLGPDAQTYGKDARSVGELSNPSLEAIAQADPDLIVSAKVRHEQQHAQLQGIAPTVFSATTGPTWKENIRLLGRALGRPEMADAKIAAYEQRARRIGDAVRAKLGRNPTISVVRFAGEPTVRLYSPTSFSGTVLTDAGFALNPTATGVEAGKISANLSPEQIGALDADNIFVATWNDEKGESAKQAEQFRSNPLWGTLKGKLQTVQDLTWMTAVGLQGAHVILDDIATTYDVPKE
ncbi:ABC transporter substrate-binding protein [Pseudonocardia sp. TRM90224]|uniref:ABC transporter substrate-binding protein n=1 Tax=Pseudonocardia sp. TRM90224 TaxID=2812678 RepID=UPI001E5571B5|nr:iron-siderophore ABC transporter substrate-binding protein [Pseudonocardia sp. TRM90224]